ncbi:GtrA family protein [Paenibacillus sp. B2(2019)]|jgi:putative flippase GtrA|uniref:GtrA family protein n=1 Tax=Paenibacillus sp. B2(2019) TaxID=2607754 RepID=UPI0011F30108|nr:GtrA family protein [Paenibacillus sp. B2(2019)]KAA1186826.1 GtrA family protein [Paenibacillus sp. B2(2019)]
MKNIVTEKTQEVCMKLTNNKLIRFLIVGVFNTILGAITMFLLYNYFGFGYWSSSALSYLFGGVISYFLNKTFTFKYGNFDYKSFFQFFLVSSVSYLVGFLISKRLMLEIINLLSLKFSVETNEQLAMLFGMGLYTILNYLGQRLLVFRK